jgi:hypothetical protein
MDPEKTRWIEEMLARVEKINAAPEQKRKIRANLEKMKSGAAQKDSDERFAKFKANALRKQPRLWAEFEQRALELDSVLKAKFDPARDLNVTAPTAKEVSKARNAMNKIALKLFAKLHKEKTE